MRGESAGTQDIIVKLTKPNNVSACFQRCFLSVTCLIQALYDRFYVPITIQRRKSLMQKTMGQKSTYGEAERSYLVAGRT